MFNSYEIWQNNTDSLDESIKTFDSKASDIGVNPNDVPAYGSAERTVNAYRANDSEYNEILSVARNMTNL